MIFSKFVKSRLKEAGGNSDLLVTEVKNNFLFLFKGFAMNIILSC